MNRARFLGSLIALMAAPKLLTAVAEAEGTREAKNERETISNVLCDVIQMNSGGLRPDRAELEHEQTPDAERYTVRALWRGKVYQKTVVFSALVISCARDPRAMKQEMAYMVGMGAVEIARSIAYDEWGEDWRRHVHAYQTRRVT